MGAGSLARQRERRFRQAQERALSEVEGVCTREDRCLVKSLGDYEVHRAEDGAYLLINGGIGVGSFADAKVEDERVLFKLSHGMFLELSKRGVREVTSPAKAMLSGLIASDGGNHFYWRYNKAKDSHYSVHKTYFCSKDKELIDIFDALFKEVYRRAPHHYDEGGGKIRTLIGDKGIFYDLQDIRVKPRPYEFHVPREHLDEEGLRAYLRGFFSGDGNISRQKGRFVIRIYSKCGRCLSELREAFIDLGFHPHRVHTRFRKQKGVEHNFSIPANEHMRFIEEIGSEKPKHLRRFREIKGEKDGVISSSYEES